MTGNNIILHHPVAHHLVENAAGILPHMQH
jgi:hypothetical protein